MMRFAPYRALCALLKRIRLPFFERVPLYNIIGFFVQELEQGYITMRASAISFSILLAIFPGIIFLFTLIPFIPIEGLSDSILVFFEQIMPEEAFETVRSTIEDVASVKRGGLLSVGFILAIFFSSNGVFSMMDTFNKTNIYFGERGYFHQRWIALILTFILVLVFLSCVILLVAGEILIGQLSDRTDIDQSFFIFLVNLTQWGVTLILLFLGISFLFWLGPKTQDRWRFITPGAILATLLLVLTSLGFSYYVENFAQYNKLYGSIGTLVVIMLWVYFNSLMLLIGFELNASIYVNKKLLSDNIPLLDQPPTQSSE